MTIKRGMTLIGLFILTTILAACESLPAKEPSRGGVEPIGILSVSGAHVFLNGSKARHGEPIYVGDTVTTGPSSSALVTFNSGGFFQLDENTDPIFVIKRLQAGICILARILVGQVYVEKKEFCFETPAADGVNNSKVNFKVSSQQTVISVLEGKVLLDRPTRVSIVASQQAVATKNRTNVSVRDMSREELDTVTRWRKNFRFPGWCCKDGRISESDQERCDSKQFSFNKKELESQCKVVHEPIDNLFPQIRRRSTPPPSPPKPPRSSSPG